jgi:hypothetical protein
MKKNLKLALKNCIVVFFLFSVANCSEPNTSTTDTKINDNTGEIAKQAQKATNKENQWEYLVVTFGGTTFSGIEENIKKGSSKLVAFQEFANLLSGHESIDLQLKLDLLGRFGWELVDTIGAIGGDQQLLMKRERIENRMEIEQEAIKKLTVILSEESTKKEEHLKEFLAELERLKIKKETLREDHLVELDAQEIHDREQVAKIKATKAIMEMFPEPPNSFLEKTKLTSVHVSVEAREDKGTMLFSGEITAVVDASEALLFDKNKYRESQARKLRKEFIRLAYQKGLISEASSLSDFKFKTEFQIIYAGTATTVVQGYENVNVKGYKGRWSSYN